MELILVSGIGAFTLLLVEFAERLRAVAPGRRAGIGRGLSHGKERACVPVRTERLNFASTVTLPVR